jgi:hypothetical protein
VGQWAAGESGADRAAGEGRAAAWLSGAGEGGIVRTRSPQVTRLGRRKTSRSPVAASTPTAIMTAQ